MTGSPFRSKVWPTPAPGDQGGVWEDSRPILTGVLLAAEADGLRLVATDSYRLAVRDLPGAGVLTEGQKVLVPSRALNELMRLARCPAG